ncbi:hypothetical protein KI387_038350, partial [Taxus chinensis]
MSLELPALELMKQLELLEFEPMEVRYVELMELQEIRNQASRVMDKDQALIKKTFDKKANERSLKFGDLVLKWDADREKLGRHSKFDAIWSGPYMVTK